MGKNTGLRGWTSHRGMGARRARLEMAPGSGTGKNDKSDICFMLFFSFFHQIMLFFVSWFLKLEE